MKDKSSIKKKTGKFAAACLALALSAGLFIPVSAEGDGQQYVPEWPDEQELKQKGSIIAEECKADASFDVYQVAEMTTSGFKETAALSAYQAVDVSDPGKNTGTLTETLKDIVVNAKVTPSVEGKVIHTTDKDAVIAEGLEPGLYLVKGKSLDEEKAEMTDFLVSVPNYNFDKDQWDFDVKVDVTKFTTIKPEQAHYKLRKLWNKQADTKLPSEIKVQIYEDGEPFEEVTLNDNNKWTFTWNTTDTKAVFTVSEENQPVKHYAAVNEKQDYYLRIVKKDKETGETITQHSASFKIYRIEGEKRIPVIQKVGLISFDTFTTNSEGKAVGIKGIFTHEYSSRGDEKGTVTTPLKLTAGEYEIEEVRSPYGYVKLDQPYRFTAGESNIAETDEDHDSLVVVNAYDEKVSSGLEIVKKIKEYSADRSFVNRTDLSGFGFELFAAEDIEDSTSGEKIAEKGKHASVLTDTGFIETGILYTDSSGHITLDALPFGHYILKETVQPEGIVPNTKEYAVDLTPQKDESRKEIRHTITIKNDTTKLSVSKKDAAAEELPGAHMSLKNENGEVVDEWVSSQKPHVMEGLSAGKTYTLCEDLAPSGYTKVNDIPIVINMDGSVQKVNVVDKAMAVMKVDNCNTAVPGARLAVFTADENGSPVGEALDRWVTDDKAHMVSGIEPGKKYVLVEEQAPAGYVKMKNRTFTLKDDAKDQTMKVKNTQVVISKEDVGGTELEGAVLTVVEKDTENIIDQWVSGCEKHLISGLEEGKTYTLKEDTAPLGYVKNSTVDFKVGSNDMEVVLIDTIERVAKVDNRGNTIKGVQLQAVDEAGNVIDTWRTGSHILDFNTEQKQSLQKGEMIAFVKEDGTSVRVQPTVKTGKKSIKAEKKF